MQNAWVDRSPTFTVGSSEPTVGILLVHGLAGSPAEMRPVQDALSEYTTYNMLLPGHGVRSKTTNADSWKLAVAEAVDRVRSQSEHVFIVGLSTGALLAAVHVAKYDNVDGIVLLAPGYKIANKNFRWVRFAKFFTDDIPEANRPQAGLTSKTGWKQLWHFERRKLKHLDALRQLQSETKSVAGKVNVPTLVVQGALDQTCDPAGATELFDAIGSNDKSFLSLPNSGHCLTVDVEQDDLVRAVSEFIRSQRT